jgi:hypothetical protein
MFNLFAIITKNINSNNDNNFNCAIKMENKWIFIENDKNTVFNNYVEIKKHLILTYNVPVLLFYSHLISIKNEEIYDFNEKEFNAILKECQKLEGKYNKIKSKKSNPAIEDYKAARGTPTGSLISADSDEDKWICIFCKKKNDNNDFVCWCCSRENKIFPVSGKNSNKNLDSQYNNKNDILGNLNNKEKLSATYLPFGNLGDNYLKQSNEKVNQFYQEDLTNIDIRKGFNAKDFNVDNNNNNDNNYNNNNILNDDNEYNIKLAQTFWLCKKCKESNTGNKCQCGFNKPANL